MFNLYDDEENYQLNPVPVTNGFVLRQGLLAGLNTAIRIPEKELQQTELYKELANDEMILEALTIKSMAENPDDKVGWMYTIAKNFAIDLMRRVGSGARNKARQIIKDYEQELVAERTIEWDEKFKLAEREFQMAKETILADPNPRFRRLPEQLKAVEMLVFRGLSLQQVMDLLGVTFRRKLPWSVGLTYFSGIHRASL